MPPVRNINDFWNQVYPLLINRVVERVDKTLNDGTEIKAYWVGTTILRVDIKPSFFGGQQKENSL